MSPQPNPRPRPTLPLGSGTRQVGFGSHLASALGARGGTPANLQEDLKRGHRPLGARREHAPTPRGGQP